MEWESVKLGDVADVKGGKRLPKGVSLISQPNKHPYIRIRDIGASKYLELTQDYEYVDDVTQQSIKRYIVNTNDILLSIVGTIGLVGVVGETLNYANQTENCVKINNLHGIDRDYLYYYLVSSLGQQEIKLGTVGAVQAKLPLKNVQSISIPLPSLEDQHRIAAILSSLDDKIENNKRINANLEAQALAMYNSWFFKYEPWDGNVPNDWRLGTLSEIGDIIGGSTPSKTRQDYYTDNGIAWLTPKDLSISKAKFTAKGEVDITKEGYASCSVRTMPRGSVIFSSRAPIGYLTIAKNEICTNQGFKSVVPKLAGTAFIYCYLKCATPEIENKATGSTFKEASGSLMKSLQLMIPSKEVLESFENSIHPLFDEQERLEDENKRLAALRDTLLPKLMKGEIAL